MKNKDSTEDEQRFENELKKLKLKAETGAEFLGVDSNEIPANIESQFLDNVIAFTKATERKEFKKVRAILGNPDFPSADALAGQNVTLHLDRAFDLLNENSIALEMIYEVADDEIYRFIIEDLFEHEMAVIDVPGMVNNFIYEEFYPNHKEDLKKYTKEFVTMLCSSDFEYMESLVTSQVEFRDHSFTSKEFIDTMADLMKMERINLNTLDITQVIVESEDYATVTVEMLFSHYKKQTLSLRFAYEYGYWYVCSLIWPDL